MDFHLLDHLVKDIRSFGAISVLYGFFKTPLRFAPIGHTEGRLGVNPLICRGLSC